MNGIYLVAGRSHLRLAKEVAKKMKKRLLPVEIENFANGEIYVRIKKKVRGEDIFIIQSIADPVNENLMETLILADALKRSSARRINLICPFLAYCRQDRKTVSREPITAKLVADLLTKAGIDRLVTIDLHADQIQGFYDIPVDHFVAYPQFARYIKRQKWKDMVIVSPDIGGVKRANKIADLLGLPLAIIDKVRKIHNQAEVAHVVGEVKGKTAIILDDIVDTAGSVVAAAEVIKKRGAKKVVFCASHALLSGPAVERLNKSAIDKLLFLDTVPMGEKKVKNCQILSVAPLLAEAISRIHKEESLGKMFDRFV